MADTVDTKVISATGRKYTVRLTNVSDGTGESAVKKVDVSTLTGPTGRAGLYLVLEEIKWDVQGFTSVRLLWDATTDDEIAVLSGRGLVSYRDVGGMVDPKSTGYVGDILLTTAGTTSGNTYDITMVLRVKEM